MSLGNQHTKMMNRRSKSLNFYAKKGLTMKPVQLKDLPRGEVFKRKPVGNKVYIRGTYDRTTKKYDCDDWNDISRSMQLRGSTIVYSDFTW